MVISGSLPVKLPVQLPVKISSPDFFIEPKVACWNFRGLKREAISENSLLAKKLPKSDATVKLIITEIALLSIRNTRKSSIQGIYGLHESNEIFSIFINLPDSCQFRMRLNWDLIDFIYRPFLEIASSRSDKSLLSAQLMDRHEIHNSAIEWTRPWTPDRRDFQRADFTLGLICMKLIK